MNASIPISKIYSSSSKNNRININLATQTSYSQFYLVRGLLQRWMSNKNEDARATIAVFAEDEIQTKLIEEEVNNIYKDFNESRLRFVIHQSLDGESLKEYPINKMRNLAIQSIDPDSHYAFIVDVDMWPSYDTYGILINALVNELEGKSKAVLVVPPLSFAGGITKEFGCRVTAKDQEESNAYSPHIPKSLDELKQCYVYNSTSLPTVYRNKKTWIFPPDSSTNLYINGCYIFDRLNIGGHSSSNIPLWLDQDEGELRRIPCIDSSKYEPYVVIRTSEMKSMPFHESLTGYGKNKVEFTERLWLNDYVFYIVGGAFVFHHPHIQSPAKTAWRQIDADLTAKLPGGEKTSKMKVRNNKVI